MHSQIGSIIVLPAAVSNFSLQEDVSAENGGDVCTFFLLTLLHRSVWCKYGEVSIEYCSVYLN